MADITLTEEQNVLQKYTCDLNNNLESQRLELQKTIELDKLAQQKTINDENKALEAQKIKLESVKIAKEILLENARSKPVGEKDVSVSDVMTFANSLDTFINS